MGTDTLPDTRTRIQDAALRLFIDHGYEATSLREIAEAVGVTKAALYYHFKSKDEIITSLVDDRTARLEAIIAWGRTLPRTHEGRLEFVRRYADDLRGGRHHDTMRFFERNPTALRENPKSEHLRDLTLSIVEILAEPGASPAQRMRCGLAIFAVHASWVLLAQDPLTDEQKDAVGLEVAMDLLR